MAREDLITKNDANYIINLAIEYVEKERCPYTKVLELLGGIKKDINELKPAEQLTPCERDGHNYEQAKQFDDWGVIYSTLYCKKCGEVKIIKVSK